MLLTFEAKFSALFSGKVTSSTLGLISTIGLGLGFVIAVSSFLAAVQERKRSTTHEELERAKSRRANTDPVRPFKDALAGPGLSLIAEHKRSSPSAGVIRADTSLADVVSAYERGGARLFVVVGVRGPIAPPEMCNGLMMPIVAFDQIYSFDRDALIKALPGYG